MTRAFGAKAVIPMRAKSSPPSLRPYLDDQEMQENPIYLRLTGQRWSRKNPRLGIMETRGFRISTLLADVGLLPWISLLLAAGIVAIPIVIERRYFYLLEMDQEKALAFNYQGWMKFLDALIYNVFVCMLPPILALSAFRLVGVSGRSLALRWIGNERGRGWASELSQTHLAADDYDRAIFATVLHRSVRHLRLWLFLGLAIPCFYTLYLIMRYGIRIDLRVSLTENRWAMVFVLSFYVALATAGVAVLVKTLHALEGASFLWTARMRYEGSWLGFLKAELLDFAAISTCLGSGWVANELVLRSIFYANQSSPYLGWLRLFATLGAFLVASIAVSYALSRFLWSRNTGEFGRAFLRRAAE